jgi:endonuclease/exonuclease/phosphatase family metal-dependent hydrolase
MNRWPMMHFARWVLLVATVVGFAVALGFGADGPKSEPTAAGVLKVMSFNVRTAQAQDGDNAWDRRTGIFFSTIREFFPDLIGFQEVFLNQYDDIVAQLPGYAFSGSARDDGKRKGEWALIGYRADRFVATGQGDFWLSEQPAVPGSKSWDAALPRICSWVRLRETGTGREFLFANTHFDHIGVVARHEAAKLLTRELTRLAAGAPVVLTGDLNTTEDDPPYAVLAGPGAPDLVKWTDSYREVHPVRKSEERSFHAFEGGTAGSRIDFIFHSPQFKAVEATIDRSHTADGHFPSDHYAVTAVLVPRP